MKSAGLLQRKENFVKDLFRTLPEWRQRYDTGGERRQGAKSHNAISAFKGESACEGKLRFIVPLKYEEDSDYRYLVATDVSLRHQDIARLHTLRWLIEVFSEDWKLHEGWCNRALQQGVEGSKRGVILSVLCNHLPLLPPE